MKCVFVSFILGTFIFSAASANEELCNSNPAEVLCELSWTASDGGKRDMQAYKTSCNFPEGNVRPCVTFRICANNRKIEIGSMPLLEENSLDLLCSTKEPLDLMGSSQSTKPTIFAGCVNKKSTEEVVFNNDKKQKKCKINLSKVLQ